MAFDRTRMQTLDYHPGEGRIWMPAQQTRWVLSGNHSHGSELSEMDLRVRALETLLTDKGYVDPAALDVLIETYETQDRAAQRRSRGGQGLAG